ncbi:MAG: NfeD family protein [Oligoflexales bacterium]
MENSFHSWILYWIVFAIILSLSEMLLPGLIAIFLGLAALIVAGGIWMGWIDGFMTMLLWWVVTSSVLLVTLRNAVAHLAPGDQWKDNIEDDSIAVGTQVLIIEDIDATTTSGRIEYRGSTWNAKTEKKHLPKGSFATIVKRDGIFWIVEPLSQEKKHD